jgi:hypothetical protein
LVLNQEDGLLVASIRGVEREREALTLKAWSWEQASMDYVDQTRSRFKA